MSREKLGWYIRLLADGTPVLKLPDGECEVEIFGVEVPQPPSQRYIEQFSYERLHYLDKPLRCFVCSEPQKGRIRARLLRFAFQDKSGEVWQDLALFLLDEGVVSAATGRFPEREEYQRHEQAAKSRDEQNAGRTK